MTEHAKVFLIGMEGYYRGEPLERQLVARRIIPTRIEGTDGDRAGSAIESLADQSAARAILGRTLTRREIGCALAHNAVYQRFLAMDAEWALVLEDDARLVRPQVVNSLLAHLATDARPIVVALHGRCVLGSRRETTLGGLAARRLLTPPTSAAAYLINRASASLLLDGGTPVVSPADWPQRVIGDLNFYAIYPWVFAPEDESGRLSVIGPRPEQLPGRLRRISKLVASVLHLRWIRHRSAFKSYRGYLTTEIRSVLVQYASRPVPAIVPPSARWIPTTGRLGEFVSRMLGGPT